MAKNDLNQPLHRKVHERPPRRPPVLAPVLISAALRLALVAAFWVAVVDDPDGASTGGRRGGRSRTLRCSG